MVSRHYIFNKDLIVFFANGGRVEYKFAKNDNEENAFTITRGEINKEDDNTEDAENTGNKGDPFSFSFIKDFKITYYDKKDFEIIDFGEEDFPYYCKLNFKFYDNKILTINMKL